LKPHNQLENQESPRAELMDYGTQSYDPYDEPYARPPERINYFAWTVAILLLTGFALAAWLGSFYIFNQPERPDSYRILQKLHKIEQPKRFELTAAPPGEFLNASELYGRYIGMGAAELAKTNAELLRNYIRNFQQVRGLVPYVVGRYTIIAVRELGPNDIFPSGMAALTAAVDSGELLMEHVYPAKPEAVRLMKQTLTIGLEVKLERTHDISAVIHAERLIDGRILVTAVPLLYGSYTVTRGLGTFRLEPPLSLNLVGGWPLFKSQERASIEQQLAENRQKMVATQGGPIPIPGASATPPPARNELVRIEQARPVAPLAPPVVASNEKPAKAATTTKGKKGKKQKLESPVPAGSPAQAVVAQNKLTPVGTPITVASALAPPGALNVPVATPAQAVKAPDAGTAPVAQSSPLSMATPVPVLPAQPAPPDASNVALASNAGGGNWKTFAPGKMPLGRLIATGDLNDVADRGLAGERIYLKGQFVVNFSEASKAVLRPRASLTSKVLHLGGGSSSTRIIVEFPRGYTPPAQGTVVNRDEMRPYEITEVRKQEDGQLNVFVREIMQPK
jgi:hypothetical protein